jgi:hypothetical protein
MKKSRSISNILPVMAVFLLCACGLAKKNADSYKKESAIGVTQNVLMNLSNTSVAKKFLSAVHSYDYSGDVRNIDSRYGYSPENYDFYRNMVLRTIESSKKQGLAVIIEKSTFTLSVLDKGVATHNYPVQFGFNPFEEKTHEGDGCTPTGIRHVVSVNETSRTMTLDYPNEEDITRYDSLLRAGKIESQGIGGAIQIHTAPRAILGRLGQGATYQTLGCVAMSIEDYKELSRILGNTKKRIPITIVPYGFRVTRSQN